jgi:hypothetical protein
MNVISIFCDSPEQVDALYPEIEQFLELHEPGAGIDLNDGVIIIDFRLANDLLDDLVKYEILDPAVHDYRIDQ